MGGVCQTGNFTHDSTVNKAEGTRQVAVAAASTQAAAVSAEITYFRARKASALANGLVAEAAGAQLALMALGTGGT